MAKKEKKEEVQVKVGKPTITSYECIIRPILSEKSMDLMENKNKITVEVKKSSNKVEIKNAFEAIFGVQVKKVNTSNVRAKEKKVGKYTGLKPAYKKAVITLAEGQALDLFKK